MNRSEILTLVRARLVDTEIPFLWEDSELEKYYSLAVRDMCRRTGVYVKTLDAIKSVANQYEYDLDGSIVLVKSIKYDGNSLTKIPYDWMSEREGTTGTVRWYCLDYSPSKFLLHYTPEEDDKDIIIRAAVVPSESEIQTAIPDKFSEFLIEGVMYYAFTKNDSETLSPYADKYLALWLNNINEVNRLLRRDEYVSATRTLVHPGLL